MSAHRDPARASIGAIVPPVEPSPADATASKASPRDERINILLVDDEPRNLVVLQSILPDPNYRLVCAESAEKALLALVAEEFALLILDIHMPDMSGFELAQLVKQRQKTAGVPIIFLTAYYNLDQHVLEGYGSGAVDYLHKPVNPVILRSKVAVFAELYRKSRESHRANRALMTEVAGRRRAEEQLRRLNDELEQRVAERTAALQRSEREMRSLADNTPDILTRFDRQLRYVFVNCAIEKTTGWTRDTFLGRTVREIDVPVNLCDRWEQVLRLVFESHQPQSLEYSFDGPQGVRQYVTRFVPEFGASGEVETVLGVTQDVTDQKRAEEALKKADRRKDEFLATLAHELRNPLAPIRTGLHLLRVSRDPTIALEMRDMLDRQFSHMIRLVDDLLNVSRITSDKLTLRKERVELSTVVDSALEASRPIIESSGHDLDVALPDEHVWLSADPTRLSQVMTNLLTNAAKYTPKGGRIKLAAAREGEQVVIRVSDTGLGIPPEMLTEVFEMFTQMNRTLDRSQGGLGIGLALVKRLVELHGGTIIAESPGLGSGSVFTVRLPLPKAGRAGGKTAEAPEAALPQTRIRGRRILVVDDNADGAESLARLLQMGGHQTRIVHNGRDALEAARSFTPEVVLLDIGLPEMDGYEVAKRFRAEANLEAAVLIAVTGWGSDEDKRQSKEAGFDFHLTKPVEASAIESILDFISVRQG
jgi:PAS domain S-box-containing protein